MPQQLELIGAGGGHVKSRISIDFKIKLKSNQKLHLWISLLKLHISNFLLQQYPQLIHSISPTMRSVINATCRDWRPGTWVAFSVELVLWIIQIQSINKELFSRIYKQRFVWLRRDVSCCSWLYHRIKTNSSPYWKSGILFFCAIKL